MEIFGNCANNWHVHHRFSSRIGHLNISVLTSARLCKYLSAVPRLAPLSEGRVEPDGTLSCAYHGWRFAADGTCVAIPQVRPVTLNPNRCCF